MEQLGQKMAAGSVWMLLFKLAERSLGLVSTIILARLLIPADFGLIAMAMSLVGILELFSNFNFDMALIRQSSTERRHYDTAWTYGVLIAGGIALVLVAIASPMAGFYGEPRLEAVIYVLAIAAFVQGFENIGIVAFRKEMQFHKEFRFLLGKKLAGFLTTVPLAFLWGNYWALVLGITMSRFVGIALSYYAHPYRPRFSFAAQSELFHFSKWLLANNISNYGRDRSSDFVIGRLAGSHSLGLYSVAYEIATLPATELVAPVNRAIFPAYAKLVDDMNEFRRRYLQAVSMVALVALPAAVGLCVTANLFIPIMLGPKWLEAIALIQILALGGAIGALQSSSWVVFIALGKPRTLTFIGLVSLVVLLPALVLLTYWYGVTGAAWAYLFIMVFLVWLTYTLLLRDLALRLRDLLSALWRPIAAMALMAAVVLGLQTLWIEPAGLGVLALRLIMAIAAGAATYVAAVAVLWIVAGKPEGGERLAIEQLWPIVRARLPFLPAKPPSARPGDGTGGDAFR